jgi:hypothetical protein
VFQFVDCGFEIVTAIGVRKNLSQKKRLTPSIKPATLPNSRAWRAAVVPAMRATCDLRSR